MTMMMTTTTTMMMTKTMMNKRSQPSQILMFDNPLVCDASQPQTTTATATMTFDNLAFLAVALDILRDFKGHRLSVGG